MGPTTCSINRSCQRGHFGLCTFSSKSFVRPKTCWDFGFFDFLIIFWCFLSHIMARDMAKKQTVIYGRVIKTVFPRYLDFAQFLMEIGLITFQVHRYCPCGHFGSVLFGKNILFDAKLAGMLDFWIESAFREWPSTASTIQFRVSSWVLLCLGARAKRASSGRGFGTARKSAWIRVTSPLA